MTRSTLGALALTAMLPLTAIKPGQTQRPGTPHGEIHRLPIPETLPDHPRVFCTQADLDRIHRDLAADDAYTVAVVERIRASAEGKLTRDADFTAKPADAADTTDAATLAQAYALTGEERFGLRCREVLLALADVYPTLETTGSSGRLHDSTLREGPLAVNCAMAYDLVANAPFMTDADRTRIEQDLLYTMAWECGHKCHHMNSSNWRTWGLCIVASCGFAIGDRALIEEAVNGVWEPDRSAHIYGAVQTINHSIFADGVHWERCMGYTYYTGSALMYVMVAAKNSGIDLWQAELPGLLGPFVGSAPHEEYGPPGNRSVKAFLDAPFYYAFQNGDFAKIGDSGTRAITYHPMYELGYKEYGDPKHAWLINRKRQQGGAAIEGWSLWKPAGQPEGEAVVGDARGGRGAFRLKTSAKGRVALVQDVTVPADRPVTVSGWVKALAMDGGSAHIRCNYGDEMVFTSRITDEGAWREVTAELPPIEGAAATDTRRVRTHVFLEGGAGEVIWDDVRATVTGQARDYVRNGDFESTSVDGRGLGFWDLVHSPKDVPDGRYDLAEDATIGINGVHENGSSLFPVGGFAVLRGDTTDVNSPAINLNYGPYGSGHDHPDRLHVSLYGLGKVLGPDAGSWGYDNPLHLTWANTTIGHNTLTVDEISQQPQGNSKSIWASERGDQRVFGVLRAFHAGERLKVARATCDTAYAGVTMDRTTGVIGPYVLDVFRAASNEEHVYDLAFHGTGTVASPAAATVLAENPFEARGYAHLTDVRHTALEAGTLRATFSDEDRRLNLLQVQPNGGEVILAQDPDRGSPTSSVIARRRGAEALYITLIEPHTGEPTVASMSANTSDGASVITVEHAHGTDVVTVPIDVAGSIRLVATDGRGQTIADEVAGP